MQTFYACAVLATEDRTLGTGWIYRADNAGAYYASHTLAPQLFTDTRYITDYLHKHHPGTVFRFVPVEPPKQ